MNKSAVCRLARCAEKLQMGHTSLWHLAPSELSNRGVVRHHITVDPIPFIRPSLFGSRECRTTHNLFKART